MPASNEALSRVIIGAQHKEPRGDFLSINSVRLMRVRSDKTETHDTLCARNGFVLAAAA